MKKQLLILSALVCSAATMQAQASGNAPAAGNYGYERSANYNYNYNNNSYQTLTTATHMPISNTAIISNNEVTVKVSGLMNIIADSYVAVFNVVQVAENITNTDQLMNAKILLFKQNLRAKGVDTSQIKVDMVSFVPKYDIQTENKMFSKTYNEVPAGFELQKNITVLYKNSAKLDDIVSAAAEAEIYDLVKVDYNIPNLQKSYDSLRVKCLQEVKNKLKSYEMIGFKLDTMRKVMNDNFVTIYPQSRYYGYQAFAKPSLNAAKKKSTNYNEATKTTSRFYQPVEYDQYDLVVNPLVTEPVVQLSYSVVVKYFTDEDKPNNAYYMILPSGEVKQFSPK